MWTLLQAMLLGALKRIPFVGVPIHYRKRAAGVRAHVGDARRLELPESFFDVVFASNFLEHFGEEDLNAPFHKSV